MNQKELYEKQKFVFGGLFLLSNKLQVIGDRILDKFTTKQWLLTVVISGFGNESPTLSSASEAMGSSHQNVKQLALKLQQKGFLRFEKDKKDGRTLRLKLTEKCFSYWENRKDEDERFISDLFADIDNEEINAIYNAFNKLHQKILKMLDDSGNDEN